MQNSQSVRRFSVMLSFSASEERRVSELRAELRKSGGSLESFLSKSAIAECDSRGILASKTSSELAEEAIAAGDDNRAANILLEDMKSKLEAKAKAEAERKALAEKLKADRAAAASKKTGKKAPKP